MDTDRITEDPGTSSHALETVQEHLDDLASRAAHHLGPDIECSIILRHAGEDRRVASSSRRSAVCDDTENAAGDGPCLTAMTELHAVLIPDVLAEPSWPAWRRQALVQGFRSAAAFPALVAPDVDIAFNLYSEAFDPWTRDVVVQADLYAQEVARVAGLALEVAGLTRAHAELRSTVEAERAVDLAVGVTMAREGWAPDAAREHLRSVAASRGVDLVVLAREVVDGVTARAHPQDRARG